MEKEPISPADRDSVIDSEKETIRLLKLKFNSDLSNNRPLDREGETLSFSFLDQLVEETTGREFPNSEQNKDYVKEDVRSFFERYIKDGVVLDLGAGNQASGYVISNDLGASNYIGVEMNFAKMLEERCNSINGETPLTILQADLYDVLSEMEKEGRSVRVIFFSGIDTESDTGSQNVSSVWSKLSNILENTGILIIGGNLDSATPFVENDWGDTDRLKELFERISDIELPLMLKVYKKKLQ
jgi:hypothetical protein